MKRLTAILLAAAMIISAVPVFAAGGSKQAGNISASSVAGEYSVTEKDVKDITDLINDETVFQNDNKETVAVSKEDVDSKALIFTAEKDCTVKVYIDEEPNKNTYLAIKIGNVITLIPVTEKGEIKFDLKAGEEATVFLMTAEDVKVIESAA